MDKDSGQQSNHHPTDRVPHHFTVLENSTGSLSCKYISIKLLKESQPKSFFFTFCVSVLFIQYILNFVFAICMKMYNLAKGEIIHDVTIKESTFYGNLNTYRDLL